MEKTLRQVLALEGLSKKNHAKGKFLAFDLDDTNFRMVLIEIEVTDK